MRKKQGAFTSLLDNGTFVGLSGKMRSLTLVEIPYVAPTNLLPTSLPTLSEIHASKDELEEEMFGVRVVGVGEHFVVKYGPKVNLIEGQTMLYVRDTTSVPIPTLYAMCQDEDSKSNYIIMERIQGNRLDREWNKLSHVEKEEISGTLKEYIDELRKLPSPGGYCSVGKQGLLEKLLWTDKPAKPFGDAADFYEGLIAKLNYSGMPKHEVQYYKEMIPQIMQPERPVFSHCDLQGKNVLCRRKNQKRGKAFDVILIDWEMSGWYPWFWEYAISLLSCGKWQNDWSVYLEKIVPGKLTEAAWIEALLRRILI